MARGRPKKTVKKASKGYNDTITLFIVGSSLMFILTASALEFVFKG